MILRFIILYEEYLALIFVSTPPPRPPCQACIIWKRLRTSAVTKVHLAMLSPASETPDDDVPSLEEPVPLGAAFGQRGRRSGAIRPADGPLPTMVVWLDTDNDVPFVPPPDSITFAITTSASTG